MAESKVVNNQLRLEFDNGLTASGKMKIKTKSFSNIVTDASNENLILVSKAVGNLVTDDLVATKRVTISEITE